MRHIIFKVAGHKWGCWRRVWSYRSVDINKPSTMTNQRLLWVLPSSEFNIVWFWKLRIIQDHVFQSKFVMEHTYKWMKCIVWNLNKCSLLLFYLFKHWNVGRNNFLVEIKIHSTREGHLRNDELSTGSLNSWWFF